MKKVCSRVLIILCGVLLLGLLTWRLWPQSLESISGLDFDQAGSVSAYTRAWHFEDGQPIMQMHSLENENADSPHFAPVLEQFKAITARPSVFNLLRPWLLDSISYGGNVDYVDGYISCGDAAVHFSLTAKGELALHSSARLYFLTTDEQFDALWEYITTHGTQNNS